MKNNCKVQKKNKGIVQIVLKLTPPFVSAAPALFFITIILAILHGLSWGVTTMFQQRFFDDAVKFAAGDMNYRGILLSLGILAAVYIFCQVLNGLDNFIPGIAEKKINGEISILLNRKISCLPTIYYEDVDKLDDINKAEAGKENAVSFLLNFFNIFTFYIPYFMFMGWYLMRLKPILIGAIILVFIPTILTQIIRGKVFTKLEDESASVRREMDYYESCIVSREYFKETRLLGGFVFFKNMYAESLHILQQLNKKATLRTNTIELLMQILTVIGYYGILLLLFQALLKQEISLGSFAAVFYSIGMLYNMMRDAICGDIAGMAQKIGSIQNFIHVLNMEERESTVHEVPKWGDIEFDHVSFQYPNAQVEAIDDISFTLCKDETIAIVGENGSGKSTLVKLLIGLYLPTKGNITYNNIDIRNLSNKALFKNTSAVFQKYQKYKMTLIDNIMISSPDEKKPEEIDKVCQLSDIDINEEIYSEGYDTMLSCEFDGIDLSGGQWQRVALARGFYREHHLIILDEPTAAIDPYEETKVYNKFAEICADKSAIIVTHRLGSVKLADRIIMMKNGRIEGIGKHDELMKNCTEYYKMYKMQEQWYE